MPPGVGTRLFIGPWVGEFGHELMFLCNARHRAKGYGHVVACSRARSAPLYADFAHEFVAHDIVCEGVCAGTTLTTRPSQWQMRRWIPPDYTHLAPYEYSPAEGAVWHRYGTPRAEYMGTIVIHARNRPYTPARNWPLRNWHKLSREILRAGLAPRVVCVGTPDAAFYVEGSADLRDMPLFEQMDAMASALLAIGPSSGPMHLAEHCGCPVVVWCGGGSNESPQTSGRYRKDWNPFHVLAHAYEYASWQPSYDMVWRWLHTALEALHGRQDSN